MAGDAVMSGAGKKSPCSGPARGRLSVVGVGPGAPDLLTLRAAQRISEADVVAYPMPDTGPARAVVIAQDFIPPDARHIAFSLPMRAASRAPAQDAYDAAARDIASGVAARANVVLLCEGDPLLYGSAMYICARLADDVSIEVIPGISSIMASAAAAGHPLVERQERMVVLPATLPIDDLIGALQGTDAAAILKVGRHLEKVREALAVAGLAHGAQLICDATLASETVCDLSAHTGPTPGYFSMVLARRGPIAGAKLSEPPSRLQSVEEADG